MNNNQRLEQIESDLADLDHNCKEEIAKIMNSYTPDMSVGQVVAIADQIQVLASYYFSEARKLKIERTVRRGIKTDEPNN